MSTKTVPYSVRVSQDDAAFLAELKVSGAVTPSDKLRTIISAARERAEGSTDYQGCLRNLGELTSRAILLIREFEQQQSIHSEIVLTLTEWSQELLAFVTAKANGAKGEQSKELLLEIEKGICDRIFTLIEKILRMGITTRSSCYEPTAISQRLEPVLEIVNVLLKTKQ